jgi:hypothetical protein
MIGEVSDALLLGAAVMEEKWVSEIVKLGKS